MITILADSWADQSYGPKCKKSYVHHLNFYLVAACLELAFCSIFQHSDRMSLGTDVIVDLGCRHGFFFCFIQGAAAHMQTKQTELPGVNIRLCTLNTKYYIIIQ